MGRMKQLWQDQRDARWQQHFDDYCRDNGLQGDPTGQDHDAACDYANDQMEQEDEANGQFGVGS